MVQDPCASGLPLARAPAASSLPHSRHQHGAVLAARFACKSAFLAAPPSTAASPARVLQPVSETGSSGGARPAACGRAVLCGGMPRGARCPWSRVAGGEGGGYDGGAREMEISCPTDVHKIPKSHSTAFMNSSTSCQG